MKVRTVIRPDETELVTIRAKEKRNDIGKLEKHIKLFFDQGFLAVKARGESYRIQQIDIIRIYREGRKLQVETKLGQFELSSPLSHVKTKLGHQFIQISQSEIINKQFIKQLRVTNTGLIEISLKSGQKTYASRRYAKLLKEVL